MTEPIKLPNVAFCKVSDVSIVGGHEVQLGVSADTKLYTADQVREAIEADRQASGEPVAWWKIFEGKVSVVPADTFLHEDANAAGWRALVFQDTSQPQQQESEPVAPDMEDLIERLLDAQQDINLAANQHMSQPLCDASAIIDEVEQVLRRLSPQPQQIPECPFPCGWQGLHKIVVKDAAWLAKADWPEDDEGVSVLRGTVIRNMDYLIQVCRAMLEAAPEAKENS